MSLSAVEFLDACEVLGIEPKSLEVVKSALREQLLALIPLLPEYGIWDVLVDHQVENKGVLETSATAGFGAAMIRAIRHFPDLTKDLSQVGAKAIAAMAGRDFVTPDDIVKVATPVLSHRIMLSPEKEMEGLTAADIVAQIIKKIEVPR